jgi:hypothetical protein
MGSYFQILKIFVEVYKPIVKQAMTSSLEFEMPSMHSIAGYRNSNMIMIYSKAPNDNGQGKIHLSILLALLLAKTTMNECIAIVSCTFSLIIIVI